MLSTKEIFTLLQARGYQFNRALGQHFLQDEEIIQGIVEAAQLPPGASVLEIGPGPGIMTVPLLNHAGKVLAIELDRQVVPVLERATEGAENLSIVREDALRADLPELTRRYLPGRFCVVSNLPYSITTPILTRLLQGDLPIDSMTVMLQREAAEKLMAKPGSKTYGPLGILAQYRCEVKAVLAVPAQSFIPPPHVDSLVVRLAFRPFHKAVLDEAVLLRLVRTAFSMRRKTLMNNLSAANTTLRASVAAFLEQGELPLSARAEQLSVENFCDLANCIASDAECKFFA